MSETLMRDIVYLAEDIGPRGSCTEGEELAADYVTDRFSEMGYDPLWHTFVSARSAWQPLALSSNVALAAAGLFFAVPMRWASAVAAGMALATLVMTLRELAHKPNPLRWVLPKSESKNVVAIAPPNGETNRRVLITSHMDTHRTLQARRGVPLFRRVALLAIGGNVLLSGLTVAGLIVDPTSLAGQVCRAAALAAAFVALLVQVLSLAADSTEYSPGANNNASGVAVLLALAERLREEPLAQTEVWLAATGCQEVGNYGVSALLHDMADELKEAVCLVIDKVGSAGPCYLTAERRLFTHRYDLDLLAQARAVAADHPELAVRPAVCRCAHTEGAAGVAAGIPTLAIVGLDLTGRVPHLHRPTDTVENVNLDVVRRTEEYAWHWLRWHDVRRVDKGD